MSIPTFIAGMLSAMISYAIVPRLVACEKDVMYQRRYMGSLLIGTTTIAFLLMGLVSIILNTFQAYILPSDSLIRQYNNLSLLIFLACLISALLILQSCLTALLNSIRYYLLTSALGLLTPLGMIISLLSLGSVIGILAVPVGMLLGIVSGILGGVFLSRRYLFPLPWGCLLWLELKQLMHSAVYTAIAMSCFSAYTVVDAYFAPQAGTGTLATLGYAQRLVIGFGGLVVSGPSAVLVPRMVELVREGDYKRFRKFLLRALTIVGSIVSVLALLLAVFAIVLVQFLFARGQFRQEEVTVLAATLRHMTPGMVAMLTSSIGLRALFCFHGAERVGSLLGLIWATLYFLVSALTYKNGAVSIAIGYSLVWILFFILLMVVIFRGYARLKLSR
ncbi:lipid II flippase MurJ [Cylindrospermopsis raciborskii]|nr:lipid II flippase MurJ [Cylindrospermopsis raciborskii]